MPMRYLLRNRQYPAIRPKSARRLHTRPVLCFFTLVNFVISSSLSSNYLMFVFVVGG